MTACSRDTTSLVKYDRGSLNSTWSYYLCNHRSRECRSCFERCYHKEHKSTGPRIQGDRMPTCYSTYSDLRIERHYRQVAQQRILRRCCTSCDFEYRWPIAQVSGPIRHRNRLENSSETKCCSWQIQKCRHARVSSYSSPRKGSCRDLLRAYQGPLRATLEAQSHFRRYSGCSYSRSRHRSPPPSKMIECRQPVAILFSTRLSLFQSKLKQP